jgi:hypothetical protein
MLGGSNPKSKRTTKDQDEDLRQIGGKPNLTAKRVYQKKGSKFT